MRDFCIYSSDNSHAVPRRIPHVQSGGRGSFKATPRHADAPLRAHNEDSRVQGSAILTPRHHYYVQRIFLTSWRVRPSTLAN